MPIVFNKMPPSLKLVTSRHQSQIPSSGLGVGDEIILSDKAVYNPGSFLDSGLTVTSHVTKSVSRCVAALHQLGTVLRCAL